MVENRGKRLGNRGMRLSNAYMESMMRERVGFINYEGVKHSKIYYSICPKKANLKNHVRFFRTDTESHYHKANYYDMENFCDLFLIRAVIRIMKVHAAGTRYHHRSSGSIASTIRNKIVEYADTSASHLSMTISRGFFIHTHALYPSITNNSIPAKTPGNTIIRL